jgi:hypothetical protein
MKERSGTCRKKGQGPALSRQLRWRLVARHVPRSHLSAHPRLPAHSPVPNTKRGRFGERAWEAGGGWRAAGSRRRAAGGGWAAGGRRAAGLHLALDLQVDVLRALAVALALDGLRLAVTHFAPGALRESVPPPVLRPSPFVPHSVTPSPPENRPAVLQPFASGPGCRMEILL